MEYNHTDNAAKFLEDKALRVFDCSIYVKGFPGISKIVGASRFIGKVFSVKTVSLDSRFRGNDRWRYLLEYSYLPLTFVTDQKWSTIKRL